MIRLLKFLVRLLFGAAVLVLVLALLRNVIARAVLEHQLRAATGMEVSIGAVRLGLTEPHLEVLDLRVFNTDDFGRATCIDIPDLFLDYDWTALRAKQIHLRKVRLELAELLIVRNDEGKNNFREMLARPEVKSSLVTDGGFRFRGIDTLNLALGKFRYSDLKRPADDDELFIGVKNQIVRNVQSFDDIRPLLNRLALERNAKRFYDKCFSQSSNPTPAEPPPVRKDPATNSAVAPPP